MKRLGEQKLEPGGRGWGCGLGCRHFQELVQGEKAAGGFRQLPLTAGWTPVPGARGEEKTQPRELSCLGEVTPTKMRVASQVLQTGPQAVGACCPGMTANTILFHPQSHPGCTRNYGPLLLGRALCRSGGRDLCGANSTELHYTGGILYTRSQHLRGAALHGRGHMPRKWLSHPFMQGLCAEELLYVIPGQVWGWSPSE